MAVTQLLLLLTSALAALGQRPFFAGSRPIGFPELLNKTTTPRGLEDKFGEGTTQRLPIEAQGDRELIDRLSKLPIDKQPFWFINWQALEANREKPQTYPQRPNIFIDGNFQGGSNVPVKANPAVIGNSNQGIGSTNRNDNTKNSNDDIDSRYATENKETNKDGTTSTIVTDTSNEAGVKNVNENIDKAISTNTGIDTNNKPDANNVITPIKNVASVPTNVNDNNKKPESDVNCDVILCDPINGASKTTVKVDRKYVEGQSVPSNQKESEFEDIEVKKYTKGIKF